MGDSKQMNLTRMREQSRNPMTLYGLGSESVLQKKTLEPIAGSQRAQMLSDQIPEISVCGSRRF